MHLIFLNRETHELAIKRTNTYWKWKVGIKIMHIYEKKMLDNSKMEI